MKASPPVAPLLRWAGGKRWLAPAIDQVARSSGATSYVEPFVGGAAVFLYRHWSAAILGDSNFDLIRCYQGLAADPALVRRKLGALAVHPDTFDRVRRSRPTSATGAAARLLYLNRCAYGGIYRLNRNGEFNVPYSGDRSLTRLTTPGRLEEVGEAFGRAKIHHADFADTLERAPDGALVYCDPTYVLPGTETSFRRYNAQPFTWADQVRLADQAHELADRGALVLVSNLAGEDVESLYRGAEVLRLSRRSPFPKAGTSEVKEALYLLGRDRHLSSLASVAAEALT
jgi:DNA adenine methylase